MPITKPQKRHLKSLVHHLKPVVIVGQHGLSEAVLNEVEIALEAHELIKVRLNAADSEQRSQMIDTICERCSAEFIHKIGFVAAFYRRHPKQPKIALPQS